MNKLEQTDPRIQLNYEEFLETPPCLDEAATNPATNGNTRVVKTEDGRKVVLLDTAGRTQPGHEEEVFLSEENFAADSLRSTSGLFGSSKLQMLKGILQRRRTA